MHTGDGIPKDEDDEERSIIDLIEGEAQAHDGYARTSPALLAVHAIERAATEFEAAMSGKSERWFFAITDIHQALTAALVETISGTAGIGALSDEGRKRWLEYFNDRHSTSGAQRPIDDRVAAFGVLLARGLDAANVNDMHGTLSLTETEKRDLERLNNFRNDLAHVKPRGWSLEIAGLPRIVRAAARAFHQLFQMAPLQLHLEEDEINRVEKAIAMITGLAAPSPNDRQD